MMNRPSTLMPRERPKLDWSKPPESPRRALAHRPGQRKLLYLGAALAVLCALYLGPLQEPATAVVATKKVLPVYCVEREDRVISVTFDASWGGDKTLQILDLLDQYNAKATFFLVGIWVDKYPELVKEIAARGHEIGNHSASHAHFTQISESKIRQEMRDCSDKIEALTGVRPMLFRPPYGDYNSKVVTVVRDEGYECVQWSVDSQDWKNRGVDDLVKRATKDIKPGDIILFHNDSQYIVEALPAVLSSYQAQGFQMIPAKDILLTGATTIDVQGKQHPAAAQ
ncbi:MAG: polysaccharide deacetylase family protein [Clostridiales bacterium]|nr:polysaccharide deacetylase family protein [Clostridiales bacterium]